MTTPTDFTLPRTGEQPVTFTGTLLAAETGAMPKLKQHHEISVYRTQGGSYVVAISYRTTWKTESPHDLAIVCKTLEQVAEELWAYDPVESVAGPPEGTLNWEQRQQETRAAVSERYDTLVSRLLARLPGAAERIE